MAPLRTAIQAADTAPAATSEATLALSLLSDLCEQKVAVFTEQIESDLRAAGSNENKSVPVTNILARQAEYRAYVQSDEAKIPAEVTQAVGNFLGGGPGAIMDGIGRLLTTGLQSILGTGTGSQREFQTYYVIVQDSSAIRFDVRAWARQIEGSAITQHIEKCLVIVAYQSSVDVGKMDLNTFMGLYRRQLAALNIPADQWETYITKAKEFLRTLTGNGGAPDTSKSAVAVALTTEDALTTALIPDGTENVQLPEMLPGTLYGLFEGATAPAPRDFLPRDPEAERLLPGVHD